MRNIIKQTLLTLFFCIPALSLFSTPTTGDSSKVMLHSDSIFLSIEGKDFFYNHIVERKQTMFSILKYYGLSEVELYQYNPKYKELPFGIGDTIKIAIPKAAILGAKDVPNWKVAKVYYITQQGDNIFRIAKGIFNTEVDSLLKWNKISNNTISIGQTLQVGWLPLSGIPDSLRTMKAGLSSPTVKKTIELQDKFLEQSNEKKSFIEQGVAIWNKKDRKTKDLFALHQKATINSIIAVYNPMKRRTVFVKVIGRIPITYPSDTQIVISPPVARLLGVHDPKFFVKTKFVIN
ncbi:MAG: LysM peptidoglycan-binding domain-containing protein [Saprospiraceae bacterium]|nr:LysM peptidoglycan-binding domain-containing protein [Saprospiraceae bacterium]